jgi:hypothetical protein
MQSFHLILALEEITVVGAATVEFEVCTLGDDFASVEYDNSIKPGQRT